MCWCGLGPRQRVKAFLQPFLRGRLRSFRGGRSALPPSWSAPRRRRRLRVQVVVRSPSGRIFPAHTHQHRPVFLGLPPEFHDRSQGLHNLRGTFSQCSEWQWLRPMMRCRGRSARSRVAIQNAPRAREPLHLVRLLFLPLGLRRKQVVHITERVVVCNYPKCRRSRPSRTIIVRLFGWAVFGLLFETGGSPEKNACVNGSSTFIGDCGTSIGAGASRGSALLFSIPRTS